MGGARRYGWSGFTNTEEYVKSLPSTFRLFGQRAAYVRDGEAQKADKEAAGSGMAQVGTSSSTVRLKQAQHSVPPLLCCTHIDMPGSNRDS